MMKKSPMRKYYIGILVLAVITIGLTIYVLLLASSSKQDRKTEKAAQDIATKLNSYVNDKQKIPENLKEAGVNDAPSTIKYTRDSDEKYTFCVTYKAASNGYYGSAVSSGFTGLLYGSASGLGANYDYDSSYEASDLYFYGGHKKGENCKTVKPYLYSSSYMETDPYTPSTDTFDYSIYDQYCEPSNQYYSLYKDYCVNGKYGPYNSSNDADLLTN